MILWMSSLGFISAFAVGPASFSIIRSLVCLRTWPWSSIAGFLLGDLIYIALAILLLQSPLLHHPWLRNILTGLTAVVLLVYSLHVLLSRKPAQDMEATQLGFGKSLTLTLSNFHLVLIYAGLFVHLNKTNSLWLGASIYSLAFIAGFLTLLWGLKQLHGSIRKFLRNIELVAACGFFCFSIYLSMELL
ncbi:LysE family transporter [Bdellovibrio sp. HCB290]|uniref:LysE family transporter n=1 Tax=Bdellovibrio sp. HCB290 TaxID=3394356 RepID=UPI0039B447AB